MPVLIVNGINTSRLYLGYIFTNFSRLTKKKKKHVSQLNVKFSSVNDKTQRANERNDIQHCNLNLNFNLCIETYSVTRIQSKRSSVNVNYLYYYFDYYS